MFMNGNESENAYEKNKEAILQQIADRNERERTYIRCGIKGEPKTYKTSIVLNSRTEEEIKAGKKVCILDWDNGAEVTWRANYNADPNIIIYNPNVTNADGSPNFKLSEEMAETFVRMVGDWAKAGDVKAFAIDGVDKWLVRCYDILTKGKKDTDFKFMPIMYGKRNRRYNLLLDRIDSLECDVFYITHMKNVYDGINTTAPSKKTAYWHETPPARFTSTIETERLESKDGVDFIIRIESSKAYPDKIGHTHKVLTVSNGKVTHTDLDFIKEGKI